MPELRGSSNEKRVGNNDGVGPSRRYETRSVPKGDEGIMAQTHNEQGKEQARLPCFKLSSKIEQVTDLRKVLDESILSSRVEFMLREVLGTAKREFHDAIIYAL